MVKIAFAVMVCLIGSAFSYAGTVTDVLGRKVEVPDRVERIVALGSSMTFISYLKAQKLVVGVEDYDKKEKFAKPYIYLNRELVKDLPVVAKGGPGRSVNIEAVIGVKPDVVFLNTLDSAEPEQLQAKLRIPVVTLSYGLPAFDTETYYKSIRIAGEVLSRQKRAQDVIKYTENLYKQLGGLKNAGQKAYIGGVAFKGFHGIDSTSADFIPFKMAKIENTADSTGKRGQIFVNKEFILNANPSVIFIDGNGLSIVMKDAEENREFYARLKAFSDGAAYLVLPDTSYFVNPEVMFANAFVMAQAAYPKTFRNMLPEKKADEIFMFYYGAPLYKFLEADTGGYRRISLKDGKITLEKIYEK